MKRYIGNTVRFDNPRKVSGGLDCWICPAGHFNPTYKLIDHRAEGGFVERVRVTECERCKPVNLTCNNANCRAKLFENYADTWSFSRADVAEAGGTINCDYCGEELSPA